jgi:hypothetical protein
MYLDPPTLCSELNPRVHASKVPACHNSIIDMKVIVGSCRAVH